MTVIQTLAGGAGGSEGEVIDISGELPAISNVGWTTTSDTISTPGYNTRNPDDKRYANIQLDNGVVCKTLMGFAGLRRSVILTRYLNNLTTQIQTVLNGTTSNITKLPDGSYKLYLGPDPYGSNSGAVATVNNGAGVWKLAEVNITISGGNITVISTTGYAYTNSNDQNTTFRIAIYGISKNRDRASRRRASR